MPSPTRDPRSWPAVGDVIRKDGVLWTVSKAGDGYAHTTSGILLSPRPIQQYVAWAKDAEVVTVAECPAYDEWLAHMKKQA